MSAPKILSSMNALTVTTLINSVSPVTSTKYGTL